MKKLKSKKTVKRKQKGGKIITKKELNMLENKLNKCQDTNFLTRKQMRREINKSAKNISKKCPSDTMDIETYTKCLKDVYDNDPFTKISVDFNKCIKKKCKKENKNYITELKKGMKY